MKRSFQLSFESRLLQNGIILVRFMSSSRILLNQSNSNLFNRFFVVRLFSRFRLITCSDFEPSLDYEQSLLFGKVRRASYLKKELRKKSMLARHLKLCEWGAEFHIAHKLQFFFFADCFLDSRDRLRHTLSSHSLLVQCSFILIGWFENPTKENNFLRSPFHCDDVFFALLPQEKALPLLYLCPLEQVDKGSRTRGALSTSERSIL